MLIIMIISFLLLFVFYFFKIIPLVLKSINNKKLKVFIFLLLLLLPFGDHIIGYLVYKTLCYTSCKAIIYSISQDKQKQRDYWLNNYIPYQWDTPVKGLTKELLLTKDLKHRKAVYINYCKHHKKNDCQEVEKYIKKNNLKVYESVPYNKKFIQYMREKRYTLSYPLFATQIINKDKLENAYINKCTPNFPWMKKSNYDYRFTCKKVNEIIDLLQLKNIINIPPNPYAYNKIVKISRYPYISQIHRQTFDKKTGEILHEEYSYSFHGGLLMNLLYFSQGYSAICKPIGINIYDSKIEPKRYQELYYKNPSLEMILIPQEHYIWEDNPIVKR